MTAFYDFFRQRIAAGGFSTEDVLASILPLMRETVEAHAAEKVAPLQGVGQLHVEGVRLWFPQGQRRPIQRQAERIRAVEDSVAAGLEIVTETRRTRDLDEGRGEFVNLALGKSGDPIERPVYLPGFVSWEHELGHHDPLTDIFSLGMLLAGLACGLDVGLPEPLERFVAHRRNLFPLNPRLHPVIARVIQRMTELERGLRSQDLQAMLRALENYRDQEVAFDDDLARLQGFASRDMRGKQSFILAKLRERLFELSRRNRLLSFRPTMASVHLTHASVPLSFDIRNIRPDQILVWNESLHRQITSGKPLSLNKRLSFNEALYLPSSLDRILTETRRDLAEFGFTQLRLVICFLHWSNLKENPPEQFESPLVLLPVRLQKKKGIRDTYSLVVLTHEAEVNPVVRHQFQQLYDIELPETIDLGAADLDAFFDFLESKIQQGNPAVSLRKVGRPQIDLIHERARRRLDQYRRRARIAGRGVRSYMDLDYSYDPANFHPLGLRLYSTLVRTPSSRLREIVEDQPRPRAYAAPPPQDVGLEKQRTIFSVRKADSGNPYIWSFDLCSVTLTNFKYRKMSLVRDFETLLDQPQENPAFESTFSLAPRPVPDASPGRPPLAERFDVVPCDPTQAASISQARDGESYIIQGPPGTGKSQTITNLIADYAARDKRVLFVCEKRAAIDVVYARLKQAGLSELCCLIHDSQADKKQFVMNLKRTYETFLKQSLKRAESERSDVLARMEAELQPLREFGQGMRTTRPELGTSLRSLLGRRAELQHCSPQLNSLDEERLPHYAQWREHRDSLARFVQLFQQIRADGVLARSQWRLLAPELATAERPLEQLLQAISASLQSLAELQKHLLAAQQSDQAPASLENCQRLLNLARQLEYLARIDQLALLDTRSAASRVLAQDRKRLENRRGELKKKRQRTAHWREKIPAAELPMALQQALALENRFFRWLSPTWWRLRKIMNRSYNFAAHSFKPSWPRVLAELQEEYESAERFQTLSREVADKFGFGEQSIDEPLQQLDQLRAEPKRLPDWLRKARQRLLGHEEARDQVFSLLQAAEHFDQLQEACAGVVDTDQQTSLEQLRRDLRKLSESADGLLEFLPCLAELRQLPPEIFQALRRLELNAEELESAIADKSLKHVFRSQPALGRFTEAARSRHALRLREHYDRWQACNAQEIKNRVQSRFLTHIQLANAPTAELSAEEKEFKKRYNRGRRELEHEFGKSMRYKSIRDLVADESGDVVRDLKPIWLMSPLSVSDTLPLDTEHVDVVIFDEASQITLEESIPSIFRARQTIVVGDQMQLPPTDFFSAKRSSDEEEEEASWNDESGESERYDLDSDSFLNHAARNLPSSMLGWHYRSRSESLISFSNWAFYEGRLLTVPEERLAAAGRRPLVCAELIDAEENAAETLRRSVSHHFLENGVYDHRRNPREADYIARLVRSVLSRETGTTIGIVAFSEAQQGEIENALQRLAQTDRDFQTRLDKEWEREEDGQFIGLIVKNLENIQGDERDLIIFSVCYGYNPQGKMLMNFGPINKSGGEKRLNVAFTRAKDHMCVVTSIRHSDITNDYNTGANCLKNYLRYAEAVSVADRDAAEMVLRAVARGGGREQESGLVGDPLAQRVAEALRERGFLVDFSIGQSHFRCDLAVRRDGDQVYRLGILIDGDEYYQGDDVLERELMRPRLFRAFGWNIAHVLAKDWIEDRDRVLNRLLCQLDTAEMSAGE